MQQTVRDIMTDYKKVPVSMRTDTINNLYMLRFLQNIVATLERIEKHIILIREK